MSYKPTPELRLKRFLYLSTEESLFVSGDPEIHNYYTNDKLTCASDLLKEDVDDPSKSINFLRNLFSLVANDPLLPRREPLFFALARFLTNENASDKQRNELYTFLLSICKSNNDLFCFIKFLSKIKKPFCTGVQNIVTQYYLLNKDPMELIKCVCESKSYHGWTHKDLFKLSHISTKDTVREVIIKYVLFGETKATEAAADNIEALQILECAQKIKEYKCCNDEYKVSQFITELDIRHVSQIPPTLMKSQMVWAALLPNLSLNEFISSLPKIYKLGFLKSGAVHAKVIDILSDKERIETSKIHPIEVYIGLKNLEKGGKPKDPHLIKHLELKEDVEAKLLADPDYKKPNFAHQEPAKCAAVLAAFYKTLSMSYVNLRPISKRTLITIDANDRMNEPCLTTKNVTCMEAAALIALCILKAYKVVTVAVFNGNTVTPVPIDKNSSIGQVIKKLKEAKHGSVIWSAPFDWAANKNKAIDIFIHIGVRPNLWDLSKEDREKDKPKEAFSNYMKRLVLPHVRLITHSLGIHNAYFSDGALNILDICGFDKNVPKIIDGFCKNLF